MNMLNVVTHGEDTLPPSNGIGPDHGVNSLQNIADIFGSSSRGREEGKSVVVSCLLKSRLSIVGSQSVQESLQWFRDAIVELISRCP